jgi:hypothetical protein
MLVRHAARTHATTQESASTEPVPPPAQASEADAPPPTLVDLPATADVAAVAPLAATTAPVTTAAPAVPARPDLAGIWRGAYFNAWGKPLLRVVSLRIVRVRDDGGIEGTLRYATASGSGECKLRPRDSTYSAGDQRLQLSPEGCSAHYPRELGVPLDFDAVAPQANILRNGRLEAPTAENIRVRLKRVSSVED